MSQARRGVEQELGLQVHHVPTSLMCQGDAWLQFVWAWIENAPAWAQCYNRQLAAYRARLGIKSPQHPMPDLTCSPRSYELPFWVYRAGEPRQRLLLQVDGGERTLMCGE